MKNNNINNTNNNTNNNVKFHFRGPERYYAVAGRQLDEATNDGTDNYLTPQSSPLKVTIITLVVITILAFIIITPVARGTFVYKAHKLNNDYTPAVYDDAGIINDDEALTKTLEEYYDLTGICPVVYTVDESTWKTTHTELKNYTLWKYHNNFKDEAHHVIVFSAKQVSSEKTTYKYAGILGKDTVYTITFPTTLIFNGKISSGINKGLSVDEILNSAFEFAMKDANSRINPTTKDKIINGFVELLPLIIVSTAFIIIYIVVIKKYIKERNAWKEDAIRNDPRLA